MKLGPGVRTVARLFHFFRGSKKERPVDEPVSSHAEAPERAPSDGAHPDVSPELIARLHRLDWPEAPEDVKTRVLERVLQDTALNGAARSRRD